MKIIYYLIIKPLSLLPLTVLHVLSDFLFIIVYYLVSYRKKVVMSNLSIAFPEKSIAERNKIAKGFYKNFCDVIVESIKSFSISRSEIRRRFVFRDTHILDPYYKEERSIMGVVAHVSNYEWMIICDTYFQHRGLGVITPLSNQFLHDKIVESRSQFGTLVVPKGEAKSMMATQTKEPTIFFFGSDQSPHKAKRAYWTKFFGVDTAVQYGAEKFAKEYDLAVFHFKISRVKRGFYEVTLNLIEDNPKTASYGSILDKFCEESEAHIRANPSDWLWTHRRWKHSKPTNEQ